MGMPMEPDLQPLRSFTILLACALVPLAFAAPLRVGTNVWPGYEPLYLAHAEGYLAESDVKLVQFRSTTQVINALRTESIEAGAVTLDEAISMAAMGLDLTIVQAVDMSSGADVIIANAGIGSMAELAGKRVGVENTALGAFMLTRALELSGMTLSQVQVISLGPGGQATAMKKGQADAVVCFEPVRGELLGAGGREVFNSTQIPGEIVDILVVRTAVLERFMPAVKQIQAAWGKALACMAKDGSRPYEIMGRRLGLDAEHTRKAFQGLTLLDNEQGQKYFQPGGPGTEAMRRLQKFMLGEGLIIGDQLPRIIPLPSDNRRGD